MKRTRISFLAAAALLALCLAGCGAASLHVQEPANVVFICETQRPIGAVGVSTENRGEVGGNANGDPLAQGDTMSFGVYQWPATVSVFTDLNARHEIARLTILTPPPEGERWYVTGSDGADGLTLELSSGPVRGASVSWQRTP